MSSSAQIEVKKAADDSWPDVERLFGRAGASNGCWCQYWLLGTDYTRRDRAQNQADLQAQIRRGGAGLLAYRDGDPVGWARFTPRTELDWLLTRFAQYDFSPDNAWSLSCFFVARRARGQGIMTTLIDYAATWGQDHDTPIEAYPSTPLLTEQLEIPSRESCRPSAAPASLSGDDWPGTASSWSVDTATAEQGLTRSRLMGRAARSGRRSQSESPNVTRAISIG